MSAEYEEKPDQTSSLEKGAVHDYVVQQTDPRYHFDAADLDRVQRKLKQRHVQMIAVRPPARARPPAAHRSTPVLPSPLCLCLCLSLSPFPIS